MNQRALHPAKIDENHATHGPGRLFIVSAPSGAGKTTLCRILREHFKDLAYSVSSTTREPRCDEKNGVDYFFITREEFERGICDNQWAEWAKVHDNYYGTSAHCLETLLRAGKDVLMDIDVQGTLQMLKRYPDSITIFIMPPGINALEQRMTVRGSDSPGVIQKRLINAGKEMEQKSLYRHVIVNDLLEDAKRELIALVEKYHGNPVH